ncbi:hypothetical protein DFJ73DRAFT_960228 [Zopfochytrium polystomum]|nr:hypothetical protein DFJ73DRAFT_960228 [Zopfochytrium polystomum]
MAFSRRANATKKRYQSEGSSQLLYACHRDYSNCGWKPGPGGTNWLRLSAEPSILATARIARSTVASSSAGHFTNVGGYNPLLRKSLSGGGGTPVGPFGDRPTKAGGTGPTFVDQQPKLQEWGEGGGDNTSWAVWGHTDESGGKGTNFRPKKKKNPARVGQSGENRLGRMGTRRRKPTRGTKRRKPWRIPTKGRWSIATNSTPNGCEKERGGSSYVSQPLTSRPHPLSTNYRATSDKGGIFPPPTSCWTRKPLKSALSYSKSPIPIGQQAFPVLQTIHLQPHSKRNGAAPISHLRGSRWAVVPFQSAIPIGKKPFQSVNEPFPSIDNDSCLLQVQPSIDNRQSTIVRQLAFQKRHPNRQEAISIDRQAFTNHHHHQPPTTTHHPPPAACFKSSQLAIGGTNPPPLLGRGKKPFQSVNERSPSPPPSTNSCFLHPPSCDNLPFESAIPIGEKPFQSVNQTFPSIDKVQPSIDRRARSRDNLPFESAIPIGKKPFQIDRRAFTTTTTNHHQPLASSPAVNPPFVRQLAFRKRHSNSREAFSIGQRAFPTDRRQLLPSSPTAIDPPSCVNLPFETAIPIGKKPFPSDQRAFSIGRPAFSTDRRQPLASSPAIDDQPTCTIARQLAVRKRLSNRQEAFSIRSTSIHHHHHPPPAACCKSSQFAIGGTKVPPLPSTGEAWSWEGNGCPTVALTTSPPIYVRTRKLGVLVLRAIPIGEKTFPIDQRAFSTDRRQPLASSPAIDDQPPPCDNLPFERAIPISKKPFQSANEHSPSVNQPFPSIDDSACFKSNRRRSTVVRQLAVRNRRSNRQEAFPTDQRAFSIHRQRQPLASSPTVVDPPSCDNLPFKTAIPIAINRPPCDNLPFETAIPIGKKPFPSDQRAFSIDRQRQLLASSPTAVDPPSCDNLPFETAFPIGEKPFPSDQRASTTTTTNHQLLAASPASLRSEGQNPPPLSTGEVGVGEGNGCPTVAPTTSPPIYVRTRKLGVLVLRLGHMQ